jgi:hypothetical protein
MKSYIEELKKDNSFYYTDEDGFYELEKRLQHFEVGQNTNSFVVDVPEEIPESIVGDNKASFVSYNGIPYNKQK